MLRGLHLGEKAAKKLPLNMKAKRAGQLAEALGISCETCRSYVVLVLLAVWFGGFTFYAGVVVHTGSRVLGSHQEFGFVTQQVTRWLNLLGALTLLGLMWNCLAAWPEKLVLLRWGLGTSWVVMLAVQVALFSMHPALDQMLDVPNHRVHDRAHFHSLHELYLTLSTVQWGATLLHLWCLIAVWRHLDRTGRVGEAA